MPKIDYADWYRREQERLRQQRGFVQPTAPGQGQYGYQAPRFGQIDREMGEHTLATGKGAAEGYASGGEIGAIIGAATGAAPGISRAARRGWDAAKEGSTENVARSLAPVSPAAYLDARLQKAGMPSWMSPLYIPTKIVSKLFGGPAPNIEKARWDRLKSYGFDVPKPEWVDTKDAALKAQDKTLAKDYVGYNEQGEWVNNKFANSGQDQDLRPQDIYEFATNFETFGRPYQVLSDEKKQQIMDIALQNNLVREQKGTVDIAWTPETYQKAQDILMGDKAVQDYLASQPARYEWGGGYKWNASRPASPPPAGRK